jgi:hypothetical protein
LTGLIADHPPPALLVLDHQLRKPGFELRLCDGAGLELPLKLLEFHFNL